MISNSHCAPYILSLNLHAGNSPEGHGRRRSGNNESYTGHFIDPGADWPGENHMSASTDNNADYRSKIENTAIKTSVLK